MAPKLPPRFVKIYSQNNEGTNQIFVDLATGVNYYFHKDGNSAGLTVLLNPNGSPVITPPETILPELYGRR